MRVWSKTANGTLRLSGWPSRVPQLKVNRTHSSPIGIVEIDPIRTYQRADAPRSDLMFMQSFQKGPYPAGTLVRSSR